MRINAESIKGLSNFEAKKRLKEYGKNIIQQEKNFSSLKILISQFASPIILLLIISAILSFLINYSNQENYFDSILILLIVVVSGVAGFVQDYKAEKAVEALKRLSTPKARVIRGGKEIEIKASKIVPGDIIVISGGDVIPADAEILVGEIEVDESVLTGESKSKKKTKGSKIFSGSPVYNGRAISRVIHTGMETEVGKIASEMQNIKERKTPFQDHMQKFTKKIIGFTSLIIVVSFAIAFKRFGLIEAVLISVSLAVAAIPENLPAVVTVALSIGSRIMTKKNALVRRLAVTESIGSVNVICTDKTGTLTKGKLEVKGVWTPKETKKSSDLALKCSFYCNNAKQIYDGEKKRWVGDETDIALKQFSMKAVKEEGKRLKEISFTSEKKMMTVVCKFKEKIAFSKGAPEVILEKSNRILIGKNVASLSPRFKKSILKKNSELSSKGYRVLALAFKEAKNPLEKNLVFIGLVFMTDPPRKEARHAVKECLNAGIRVIMITGDNPLTAKTIGEEVGIKSKGVITGSELEELDDSSLKLKLDSGVNIFARVNPFHKLRILEVLQKNGNVVAMTGDGVNDSLALKKADVGIAMGIKGTEVAKEASDITLLDDNFATIRTAIKEGRRIFDNIRKFVDYLFSCNVAEVIVVFLSILFFPFIVLYPIQILWINLITDGLPALALSMDPARPDVMKRKPRKKNEGLINKKLGALIIAMGLEIALMVMLTFLFVLKFSGIEKARTALFTGFILYEVVRIAVIRHNEGLPIFKRIISNKFLAFSLIASLMLQLVLIYSPIAAYFKVSPLGLFEWSVLLIGTFLGFFVGILISKIINVSVKGDY